MRQTLEESSTLDFDLGIRRPQLLQQNSSLRLHYWFEVDDFKPAGNIDDLRFSQLGFTGSLVNVTINKQSRLMATNVRYGSTRANVFASSRHVQISERWAV
jgi:hypothetical protein